MNATHRGFHGKNIDRDHKKTENGFHRTEDDYKVEDGDYKFEDDYLNIDGDDDFKNEGGYKSQDEMRNEDLVQELVRLQDAQTRPPEPREQGGQRVTRSGRKITFEENTDMGALVNKLTNSKSKSPREGEDDAALN